MDASHRGRNRFGALVFGVMTSFVCIQVPYAGYAASTKMLSIMPDGTTPGGDRGSVSADGSRVAFIMNGDIYGYNVQTTLVSKWNITAPGASYVVLSGDGTVVAFVTRERLLPAVDPFFDTPDVYSFDSKTGLVELISTNFIDGQVGNGPSGSVSNWYELSINADGNFIAFTSSATDLVPGDTGGRQDVFVRNRSTRGTQRVSLTDSGAEANANSYWPSISGDGRYVAFGSAATNLISGRVMTMRDGHIYCRDMSANLDPSANPIVLVSSRLDGIEANWGSGWPSISDNGCVVAFYTWADNLNLNDTAGSDIVLRDLCGGKLELVTRNSNANSSFPALSADGRFVAFWSQSASWGGASNPNYYDIFLWDRRTGSIEPVSVTSAGASQNNNADSLAPPSISDDGLSVVFGSLAANLGSVSDNNNACDVFLRSRQQTVTITEALYNYLADSFSVKATSTLGQGDALLLSGYGAMTWKKSSSRWEILVTGVTKPPSSILVCGNSGCDSTY